MKRALRKAFGLGLGLALMVAGGCTHSIHELYMGSMDDDVHYGQGRWVHADADDFIILGFEMDSNYVNKAYRDLGDKCEGRLAQVTTELVTSYKFLSYDQKIVLRGLCI